MVTVQNPTVEHRFWAKVDPCRTDGCAIWIAGTNRQGYGAFGFNGRTILAHHFLVGKPPADLEWDHLCRVPGCVWPEHLELVTHSENASRGNTGEVNAVRQRAKTHCPLGHPYDETNTYTQRNRNGSRGRGCRACRVIYARKRRLRLKAKAVLV